MVQIHYRYFNLTFERIFSDVPFLRSLRHKNRNFDADVEKERKKERKEKKTRVGLHKCCASHRIKNIDKFKINFVLFRFKVVVPA